MARVYSTSFFDGLVFAGTSTTVPLSSLSGVIVLREVLVTSVTSTLSEAWGIHSAGGAVYLNDQGIGSPFTSLNQVRTVWPAAEDMILDCSPVDCYFWISGYLLGP